MKKILYLLSCIALSHSASVAQTTLINTSQLHLKSKPVAQKMDKRISTGLEGNDDNRPSVPPSAAARSLGKSIGSTNYDLGSNGAVKSRLINYGNKKVSGAFNYGTGDITAGFADRGSGYNTTDATGKFAAAPKKRIESVRTGFTNLCVDADGNEYLFAHRGGFQIMMSKKLKGATTWTESNVPTSIPGGVLWSSAAIGGKNGKTIHIIALTAPTGTSTNGFLFNGINGAMVYFRSTDGGATWDKKDVLLPGIDSTRYNYMSGDNYSVTCKGDKVAIASYGSFYDTEIWISEDNGNKFTRKTVFDFPLPNYHLDDLYEVKDIPKAPSNLDSLAIQTTDGAGTIFIDNNNKVQLIVGNMFVLDDKEDNQAYNYYTLNGFLHWDENKPDSLKFLDLYPDVNGNDSIDVQSTKTGTYFNALTCYPTLAQGADNTLYMAYTAPSENYTNDDKSIYYRHVFVVYSKNGGKTWSKPYDIIDDKTLFDTKIFDQDLAECTFPYLATNVDNSIHLIYQMDNTPGMHVSHPSTQTIDFEDNEQIYTDIPTARITASKDVVTASMFQFGLSPNPTTNAVNINYTLTESGKVSIRLYDLTGRQIQQTDLGNQNVGVQNHLLSLNLNAGLYFVQLNVNGKIATQKLVVR
jgi:hypothetical protein